MKFLRYGPAGQEKPGILDDEGKVRDLSALVPDLAGDALNSAKLAEIAAMDISSLPLVSGTAQQDLRLGVVISTGTPPDVGMGQKTPVYLKGGEIMRLGIERLGEQTQHVLGAIK